MPAPLIPWSPSNIPSEIQNELNRRKVNRSFKYLQNGVANWDFSGENTGGSNDWNSYRGPMVSWVRVCSNGYGRRHKDTSKDKPRFILHGGKGFYETYGFQKSIGSGAGQQIIGYCPPRSPGAAAIPHIIENSLTSPSADGNTLHTGNHPIHVPTPEISKIEAGIFKELFRRLTIEWVCFSWKQLEYMTPYFLVPGLSVMVEWGWNHYNPASLVNLSDEGNMRQLWNDSYPLYTNGILRSKGNYEVTYGIITNFNWSVEGNKIICSTEVTSKDRLYAGIAKNSALIKNPTKLDKKNGLVDSLGWISSLKNFIDSTGAMENLPSLVESRTPLWDADRASDDIYSTTLFPQLSTTGNNAVTGVLQQNSTAGPTIAQARTLPTTPTQVSNPTFGGSTYGIPLSYNSPSNTATSVGGQTLDNEVWKDIARRCLVGPKSKYRSSYIHGAFFGRLKNSGYGQSSDLFSVSKPSVKDFDFGEKGPGKKNLWICMGLIVEILNYFSQRSGVRNKPMFEVDITTAVIGGHPNLISCDSRVLIPNYQAPKFHYGIIGIKQNAAADGDKKALPSDYNQQYVGNGVAFPAKTEADDLLRRVFYQSGTEGGKIFRSNLDRWINWYRYKFDYSKEEDYSFPASKTYTLDIPDKGSFEVEKDNSGLLANIYISYDAFKNIIQSDNVQSYFDIYQKILELIMDSTDDYWDLALTEAEGTMTVVDRKFTSKSNFVDKNGNSVGPLYVFDYYDSDSIIKSFKFRPAMTDAQATRAIYGRANNPDATYVIDDKYDILNYLFDDAIIRPEEQKVTKGPESVDSTKTYFSQLSSMVSNYQWIDKNEEDTLQMTVPPEANPHGEKKEVIKLVLHAGQELLKLLLHDNNKETNQIYSAIQPGIVAELTIQGIGGLRTFQYFLIKNLPAPYSHLNVVYRTTDVHHSLEAGNWETTIRAGLIPLTKYITDKIGYPADTKPII